MVFAAEVGLSIIWLVPLEERPARCSPAAYAGDDPNGDVQSPADVGQRGIGVEEPDEQGGEQEDPLPGKAIGDPPQAPLDVFKRLRTGVAFDWLHGAVLHHRQRRSVALCMKPATSDLPS